MKRRPLCLLLHLDKASHFLKVSVYPTRLENLDNKNIYLFCIIKLYGIVEQQTKKIVLVSKMCIEQVCMGKNPQLTLSRILSIGYSVKSIIAKDLG